ncbi:lipopolysaccharide-induced tumor necrosis factor-alpha factor homolog [Convolutriloba macropyga]|uniref:lipopolysaccharide-induced tumor necrosis factor-alpha factor homolog n=1 Tax=Convolutriloba macropyga TaxID=536237 RepID=UPI003F52734F
MDKNEASSLQPTAPASETQNPSPFSPTPNAAGAPPTYPQQQYGSMQSAAPYPTQQYNSYPTTTSTTHVIQANQFSPPPTYVTMPGSSAAFGHYPQVVVCHICRKTVTTTVVHSPSFMTFVACIGIWFIPFMGLGCCLIPFFVNECKRVTHTCPSCHALLSEKEPCS